MKKNYFLDLTLKHLLAPIITGLVVWGVTKSFAKREINHLQKSIESLDNIIKSQRYSLDMANNHIDSLNGKWQRFQEIMGVAIGGNVTGSVVIGTMTTGSDDDDLQKLKELQELLK